MLPIVAIIGKPNVGKSTLFNEFAGFRKAVVSPIAGTTRDRHYMTIAGSKPYLLVDTGGIASKTKNSLEDEVVAQASLAIAEAELILFLVDSRESLTAEDHFVTKLIRRSNKKCLLIATKCDSPKADLSEFFELGFGEPIGISAIHRLGMETLRKHITKAIPKAVLPAKSRKKTIRLAILGRPNVGKSSLINGLLKENRLIVNEQAGTTIDAVDSELEWNGAPFSLIDTAGVRRRGKIEKGIERYSFLRSLQAAQTADVCVILIDGEEGITAQDQHIIEYVLEKLPGIIIAVNKLDMFESDEDKKGTLLYHLRRKLQFVPWAPVVFVSAKTQKNLEKLLELSQQIEQERQITIPESILRRWFEKTTADHIATGRHGRTIRMSSFVQKGINPPHFVLTTKSRDLLHFSYFRYIENKLREAFHFTGTAVKIDVKRS